MPLSEHHKTMRGRNIVLGVALAVFVVLVFVVSIVKFKSGI
jgi:hypothetical protein